MPKSKNTATPKVDAGESGATVGTPGDISQAEASNAQVQERVDQENEKGFVGVSSTPEEDNHLHTFQARAEGALTESEKRDTFTRTPQPSGRPSNAGEVLAAEKAEK